MASDVPCSHGTCLRISSPLTTAYPNLYGRASQHNQPLIVSPSLSILNTVDLCSQGNASRPLAFSQSVLEFIYIIIITFLNIKYYCFLHHASNMMYQITTLICEPNSSTLLSIFFRNFIRTRYKKDCATFKNKNNY